MDSFACQNISVDPFVINLVPLERRGSRRHRPVGAFSKSSRPYRSRVSVCPRIDTLSRGRGGIWLELCATPLGPGIAAVAPTATSRQVFWGLVLLIFL